MSQWLKQLPLKRIPGISTPEGKLDSFPEWAAFMTWSGFWLRSTKMDDYKLVMLLVVPSKVCCSAFCSLGALIASTKDFVSDMTWDEFLALPAGIEVYLKIQHKSKLINFTGKISEVVTICEGETGRNITYGGRLKDFRSNPTTISVMKNGFTTKQISLIPHVNKHNFEQIRKSYTTLVESFDNTWLSTSVTECRILTNKAEWVRNIENTAITLGDFSEVQECQLGRLLLTTSDDYHNSRVEVLSHKSIYNINSMVRLTVSEGREALFSGIGNLHKTQNTIFILSTEEYDADCLNQISSISQHRSNIPIELPLGTPDNTPCGIEMVMFALKS